METSVRCACRRVCSKSSAKTAFLFAGVIDLNPWKIFQWAKMRPKRERNFDLHQFPTSLVYYHEKALEDVARIIGKRSAFLIQIKIQRALPFILVCMNAIRDFRTTVEKLRSLLRKGAQVCAEIGCHVVDAEREIKRIEQRLRVAALIDASDDAAARIEQASK